MQIMVNFMTQLTKMTHWEDKGIYWAHRCKRPGASCLENAPYEKHKVYAIIEHKTNPRLNQRLCVAVFNYDGRTIELQQFSVEMFEMFLKSDNYIVTVPELNFSILF